MTKIYGKIIISKSHTIIEVGERLEWSICKSVIKIAKALER
ncbi:hypothetical protein M947_03415 [Sulfurimonas hongkongensis]|uniref:Uncharacterized protein n=1 Tax=Sulfurimonas hongkongensis TaxID=1172190 RepID=T0KSW7_9BACT|nr:hypothetical protein M947_03415 [Sulfurimonas hongkongensis]